MRLDWLKNSARHFNAMRTQRFKNLPAMRHPFPPTQQTKLLLSNQSDGPLEFVGRLLTFQIAPDSSPLNKRRSWQAKSGANQKLALQFESTFQSPIQLKFSDCVLGLAGHFSADEPFSKRFEGAFKLALNTG